MTSPSRPLVPPFIVGYRAYRKYGGAVCDNEESHQRSGGRGPCGSHGTGHAIGKIDAHRL